MRDRENLPKPDRLAVAQRILVFDQQFQREYWPSSAPTCLANQRLQLRCRVSTVDAFTRHCRCALKILRHVREIQRGSSVYHYQIAGHSKIAVSFALQNCADRSRILGWAFASIDRSAL